MTADQYHTPGADPENELSGSIDDDFMDNPLRIRCADAVEIITDFLDGTLSDYDRDALIAHLEGCEGCRVFVDQVEMTVRLTSDVGERDVVLSPPDIDDLIRLLKERSAVRSNQPPQSE